MTTDISTIDSNALEALKPFYTQSSEDVNAVVTFEEALASSGFAPEDITFIGSPYTILQGKEKDALLATPFYIRSWRFALDKDTQRPYVVLHAVTQDNALYILTDGSTGIYTQLKGLTEKRLSENHATPVEHMLVANGLRKSEYGVTKDGQPAKAGEKVDSMAATYYLA